MARIKLTELKTEIQKYLGIPYFKNTGKYKNSGDNVMVGKGNAHEIALKTVEMANSKNIKLLELDDQQIYNFQKKHHLGIDCSGLVCHLVNFCFDKNLNPRRTSADMLTTAPIASPIDLSLITTGDLIRLDSGHHVLLVVEKTKELIVYIHSSDKTTIRGVHYGTIEINNPKADLDKQNWSDVTKDGKPYSDLYHPAKGDGVFRVN
ncbi:C40 family peptidase [Candidatus Shapirobacteria bacterium]|nr:C40 family peptidase [Candidatus Shapirobacteria bacterium]